MSEYRGMFWSYSVDNGYEYMDRGDGNRSLVQVREATGQLTLERVPPAQAEQIIRYAASILGYPMPGVGMDPYGATGMASPPPPDLRYGATGYSAPPDPRGKPPTLEQTLLMADRPELSRVEIERIKRDLMIQIAADPPKPKSEPEALSSRFEGLDLE